MSSPRTPVRRVLFPSISQAIEEGRIDNVANILQEEIRRSSVNAERRWGFDFVNERPIPGGPYEWVKIGDDGEVELFDDAVPGRSDEDSAGDNADDVLSDLNENLIGVEIDEDNKDIMDV